MRALARHTLAWPTASGFAALGAQATDAVARDALARWKTRDWPLIVRRRVPDMAAELVALGLPLPPAEGKRRLAFSLPPIGVGRHQPPPPLRTVIARVPARWRAALAELDENARAQGGVLHAFGAFAWQALTGLDYVHADSDVDVVVRPRSPSMLATLVAVFTQWEEATKLRVDAELAFGDDAFVQWREWRDAASGTAVLVKSLAGARLAPRASLLPLIGGSTP